MTNNKLNIVFFITDISLSGGTERITISLANQLCERGFNVVIISLISNKKPFYSYHPNINFEYIFSYKRSLYLNYLLIVLRLRKIIKKYQANYIIDVVTTMSLFSVPATWYTQTKVITWEHFNFDANLGRSAMDLGRKIAAKYSAAIVTLTNQDAKNYEKHLVVNGRLVTIPNFLHVVPNATSACANTTAIAVGRLTYQKGFDNMIDIWHLFKQYTSASDWKLLIIGNGEDKEALQGQIEHRQLTDSVEIIPATAQIEKYYLDASLYLMTSRWEGLPMVLIESQAYGIPAVSFNCKTGPSDVIIDGENGFLVPINQNQDFATKLNELASNRSLIKQMSASAKQQSVMFNADQVLPLWLHLFETLKH